MPNPFMNVLSNLPMLLGGPGAFGAALSSSFDQQNAQAQQAAAQQVRGGALMQMMDVAQQGGKNPLEVFKMLTPDQQSAILSDPNWHEDFAAVQDMMAGPKPLQGAPGTQFLNPNDPSQVLHTVPFNEPVEIQEMRAYNLDPKIPEHRAAYAEIQRAQTHGPQAPKLPSDAEMLQWYAQQQGHDLKTKEGMLASVEGLSALNRSRVQQPNPPAGHVITGYDDAGVPILAPMVNSEADLERKDAAASRERIVSELDAADSIIANNPSEFGVVGSLKEGARAATAAVGQVAGSVSGVVPGASGVETLANAARQGPLAEPATGNTKAELQARLDRVAVEVARTGSGLNDAEVRAAQQEINNMREALDTGGFDPTTVRRRIASLRDLIAGGSPAKADAPQASAPGAATSPTAPQSATTPVVTNKADYDALPAGAEYTLEDGSRWRKGRKGE